MKRLVNLSAAPWLQQWLPEGEAGLETFINECSLDGIEWLVYNGHTPLKHRGIKGWHLRYWPYWLDLWHGDWEALNRNGIDEEVCLKLYGGTDRQALIDWYRSEQAQAEAHGADYLVLHCCHVDFDEVFHRQYRYTDDQVVAATIELVNAAFEVSCKAPLLFENLWWPGLRFDDHHQVAKLMEQIHYPHKGLLLDLSHMAVNHGGVWNSDDLLEAVSDLLKDLGDYRSAIKAIHCSNPFVGDRFRSMALQADSGSGMDIHPGILPEDKLEVRFQKVLQVIQTLDNHRPLSEKALMPILELIKPDYYIHELLPSSLQELKEWLLESQVR